MIKATVEINLYEFSELSEKAKRKAIDDQIKFLTDVVNSNYYDTEEEYAQELSEVCKDDVAVETIEMNEYLFYKNGRWASVIDDRIYIDGNKFRIIEEE